MKDFLESVKTEVKAYFTRQHAQKVFSRIGILSVVLIADQMLLGGLCARTFAEFAVDMRQSGGMFQALFALFCLLAFYALLRR